MMEMARILSKFLANWTECTACKGEGKVEGVGCWKCGGTGVDVLSYLELQKIRQEAIAFFEEQDKGVSDVR